MTDLTPPPDVQRLRPFHSVGKFLRAYPDGKGWIIRQANGGGNLGLVRWYADWKCWVFQPLNNVEFSPDCLVTLGQFMEKAK